MDDNHVTQAEIVLHAGNNIMLRTSISVINYCALMKVSEVNKNKKLITVLPTT